jgi:glycerol-1-phosphate dehydrogenase [NAD(P)+]
MKLVDPLQQADPTDLEALRRALSENDAGKRLLPIGLRRIEIGNEALYKLPKVIRELTNGRRIAVLMDPTPMCRNETDLKSEVLRLLAQEFDIGPAALRVRDTELHADENTISEAHEAIGNADCVVVVGSGTITDVSKEATKRAGNPPLVVVQTAASVNAFADNLAVLLKSGVKRTVVSRWPDALIIDLPTLAFAPPEMNRAGLGDLLASWTAPADWYLASLLGMDSSYHPAPAAIFIEQGRELLDAAGKLQHSELKTLELLARMLTLSSIAMGISGSTAVSSGAEHLISHLIDVRAGLAGRPIALHGAQVGVSAVIVAGAWEILLDEFDPGAVDLRSCFPDPKTLRPLVQKAFEQIDTTGRAGDECWSDYSQKLDRWHASRPKLEAFLQCWPDHREELRKLTAPQRLLASALGRAGAPLRFSELDPPTEPEVVRWTLKNCQFMRNRFSIADLFFFLGWWGQEFHERLLKRAEAVGGGL